MRVAPDIAGKTFGLLTAISFYGIIGRHRAWTFRCSCGNTKVLKTADVVGRGAGTKSCGCLRRGKQHGVPAGHYRCSACDTVKIRSDFYSDSSSRRGISSTCKLCLTAQSKTPEQRKYKRAYHVFRTYGITIAELESILEKQNGGCAICGKELTAYCESGRRKSIPHVDHDHATGRIRGILCYPCNVAIGLLSDNSNVIEKAASYIRNHAENIDGKTVTRTL